MYDKKITLSGEKELRIFMHPLRQKILRAMRLQGAPMTAKQLADKLDITPSSAMHHIKKIESLGIVGIHHQELIHGITATFYHLLPVTVSLGISDSDLTEEKKAVGDSELIAVYGGFNDSLKRHLEKNDYKPFDGDLLTGVVHLKKEDAQELYKKIMEFISKHEVSGAETVPYEYALIMYNAKGDK